MEAMTRPTPRDVPSIGVDWACASRAKPGERETGDRAEVIPFPDGALIAAIDGLGHGEEAAAAARAACAALAMDPSDNAIALVRRCHLALAGSRGVAMSLASVDVRRGVFTWIGVGNVEGVVVQTGPEGQSVRSRMINRGGVVGSALPLLRAEVLGFSPGDLFVLATDGIDQRFADDLTRDLRRVEEIANGLLARFAKLNDDALVLVARAGGVR